MQAAAAMEGGGVGQESKAEPRGLWEASTATHRVTLPLIQGNLQRAMSSLWWVVSGSSTEDGRDVGINEEGRPMGRKEGRGVAVRTCFSGWTTGFVPSQLVH